jgi:integrase
MKRRRGHRGQGSISSKPNQDGYYVGRLPLGSDGNGKRRVRTLYARTVPELLQKMNAERNRLAMNIPEPSKETVGAYLERWLSDTVRPNQKPRTHEFYERIARKHVIPYIGHIPVGKMNPSYVRHMLAELERVGAKPRKRQMAHATVRKAFNALVKEGALVKSPVVGVEAPRAVKEEMKTWTEEELNAFLAAAKGVRLGKLFSFLACTGARLGEALGLHWSEVDKEYASVHISHTLVEIKGLVVGRDEVKTKASKRQVSLDAFGKAVLLQQRALLLGEGNAASPWVFPNRAGKPHCSSEIRKQFRRIIKKAGVPRIRPHDLRHTHATLLLKACVHPKIVQARLGHSSIVVTLDTYSHVIPSMDEVAAMEFGKLIKPQASEGVSEE